MASPQLLQRCRAGDAEAINELIAAHRPAVYRLALSLLDDSAEADEAAQDSLLRAVNALSAYRGDAAFTTWLYAITLNLCRMRLRQRRARERLTRVLVWLRLNEPTATPEDTAAQNERDAAVWAALRALPDDWREAIVLRYYHDWPIAEMARLARVSERTIHTRLSRAHERLRALLKDKADYK